MGDILNQMNGIGTKTGNTDLDNFISTTTEMYSQVDVTTQLQLFKGIQAQQECGASTYSLTAASTTSTRNKVAVLTKKNIQGVQYFICLFSAPVADVKP